MTTYLIAFVLVGTYFILPFYKSCRLPFEMPQDPDWLFHLQNLLPQVMNRTTNTRIIRFLQHKNLDLCFTEKTRNNFKIKDFLFLQNNCILSCLFQEKRKCIFHFRFPRKEKTYSSSDFLGERRETSHQENKKNYLFLIVTVFG